MQCAQDAGFDALTQAHHRVIEVFVHYQPQTLGIPGVYDEGSLNLICNLVDSILI